MSTKIQQFQKHIDHCEKKQFLNLLVSLILFQLGNFYFNKNTAVQCTSLSITRCRQPWLKEKSAICLLTIQWELRAKISILIRLMDRMLDNIRRRHQNICCNMLVGCNRRRTNNGNKSITIKSKTRLISTKTDRHNKTAVFTRTDRAPITIPTSRISIRIKHHTSNNKDHMGETSEIEADDVANPISSSSRTNDKINFFTVQCWKILGLS